MSCNYYPIDPVSFDELFDGRLASFGIYECVTEDSTPTERALTDGTSVLWMYRDLEGGASATRFGGPENDPGAIIAAIEKAFNVLWQNEDDFEDAEDEDEDEDEAGIH